VCEYEDLGMVGAVNRINAEQAGEEQDLRDQKKPHAQLVSAVLLGGRIEPAGQLEASLVAARVVNKAHVRTSAGAASVSVRR